MFLRLKETPMTVLPHEFYMRDTCDVARDLLGKELVRVHPEGTVSGVIVETEAYRGVADKASHAFGGRLSRRTAIMFEEGGFAYVYLIYGMYWCLNITTRESGVPECVLIRALEPLAGIDLMFSRRNIPGKKACRLTNGPGKLCRALAIDGSLYGADICGGTLFVQDRQLQDSAEIMATKRINIAYAEEAVHHEWRYFLKGHPCVSRG